MTAGRYYILDANHNTVRVDLYAWAEFFENVDCRRVAHDEIGDVRISTVFLGVDHRHYGKGPPLLFETMIFGGEHDQEMWRYSSWDDAEAGHKMAVKKVKAHQSASR